jgi:hypothetical protein
MTVQAIVDDLTGVTSDGGFVVKMTNKTGAASVKGMLVEPDGSVDLAFEACDADGYDPIGIVYEAGIADGSECWVVIAGIADALIEDNTAATRHYWVRVSADQAGRVNIETAAPSGGTLPALDAHFRECGHALESQTSGTDVLCKIAMHFN